MYKRRERERERERERKQGITYSSPMRGENFSLPKSMVKKTAPSIMPAPLTDSSPRKSYCSRRPGSDSS